jgi:hypothetical protein
MSQTLSVSSEEWAALRRQLDEAFNDSELRNLCFDLGVSYDDLNGENKSDKARELISHLGRRGRIEALVALCSQLRPAVAWGAAGAPPAVPAPRPPEPGSLGGGVSATISNVSGGQAAVGAGMTQIGSISGQTVNIGAGAMPAIGGPPSRAMPADVSAIRRRLSDLEARIEAESSPEHRRTALDLIEELDQALTSREPDETTLEYARRWFARNLPALAEAVNSVIALVCTQRLSP